MSLFKSFFSDINIQDIYKNEVYSTYRIFFLLFKILFLL